MDIHQPEWCGVCFTSFGTPGLDIRIDVHLLDSRFGCASCELLAQVNQEHSPHLRYRTEPLLGASLAPWLDEDPTPPSIEIKSDKRGGSGFDSGMVKYILIKGHDGERRYVDIFTERDSPSPWPMMRTGKRIAAVADSTNCMLLAKTWISDCISNHPECLGFHGEYEPTTLPHRVLCVKPEQNPFLFINSAGKVARYAALSHRWGNSVPLQLKKATLDSWQSGMSLLSFPPTFQDAIRVCRALSIDYLWIDSLCILQDSLQDWNLQASRMCQVYSHAYVTIAADASSSSAIGFLDGERGMINRQVKEHRIWADKRGHCPVPYPLSRSDPNDHSRDGPSWKCFSIYSRPHQKVSTADGFSHHYSYTSVPPRSSLSDRGWVLQETLLSPRILHFMPEEMSWQCSKLCCCECCTEPYYFTSDADDETVQIHDLERNWDKVVFEFTDRHLTFDTDRLAALAGLAARAHQFRPNGRYLAGIWEDSVLESLCWTADTESPMYVTSKRIRPVISPSWSWASVTGRISFRIKKVWGLRPCALRDIVVDYPVSSDNIYGSVTDASLTATASLFEIHAQNIHYTFGDYHIADIHIKDPSGAWQPIRHRVSLVADTNEDLETMELGEGMVMANLFSFKFFLLLQVVDEQDCKFRRVGVLVLNSEAAMGLCVTSGPSLSASTRTVGSDRRITIV